VNNNFGVLKTRIDQARLNDCVNLQDYIDSLNPQPEFNDFVHRIEHEREDKVLEEPILNKKTYKRK